MSGPREVPRTAAFAWSPGSASPFLATGTKAGAVDEGFSNDTQLELWDLKFNSQKVELESAASIETDSRFNDIAWTKENDSESRGIIAGALENGSLDLWDANKVLAGEKNALMSRTTKHSGSIKALQFNTYRSGLLATVGAKGELFISDLNNIANPFRMGNAVARADDFECLDWNKKSAHIMVTGSSGGTMTVWDIKNKRESLTLNNMGRKPVSAVVWDPVKATRLVTAIPSDQDPLILVWDLRNANVPERILKGHDGGVLSLSWCQQDSDLLLSCGKDNRTICWNPQTGEQYGEYPIVTNWTFQTRWNPTNPMFLATASFDGKVSVHKIQNAQSEGGNASQVQVADDDDFFSKAQSQPQGPIFSLSKPPKWLQRPCGANFGFGGKVISFKKNDADQKKSIVRISTFPIDQSILSSTEAFEIALKQNDLEGICEQKIAEATAEEEKTDWKVIKTLTSDNTRKELVEYLGFSNSDVAIAQDVVQSSMDGEKENITAISDSKNSSKEESHRLSSFFDNDGDNFLTDLAATKSAKTNNPFHMYSGVESKSDRMITRFLLIGNFEKALDLCLREHRMSDAFMIAICGGQRCIEKAQKAYFGQKDEGPNYLRLLASVVGKNLWDLVHNADLESWKDVMAALCTYADAKGFPDLCEALGDRLEEKLHSGTPGNVSRKDATFCYLAGSKLEKVVSIWIAELQETESSMLQESGQTSPFSVHARSLQSFIEKVTIFREVTSYRDERQDHQGMWKLSALYDKYTEYADIVSAHGQLEIAERYLDLLPNNYAVAEASKHRIKQATRKPSSPSATKQTATTSRAPLPVRGQQNASHTSHVPDFEQQVSATQAQPPTNPYAPATLSSNPYAPQNSQYNATLNYGQPQSYQQQPGHQLGGVPPPAYGATLYQNQQLGPPPRNSTTSASIPPPSKDKNMSNWNDLPEGFVKPPTSRRNTPGPSSTIPAYQPSQPQPSTSSFTTSSRSTPPIGPPPKASGGPPPTGPPRVVSPTTTQQLQQTLDRPPAVTNAYAPPSSSLPTPQQQTIPRGPSPYNAPPGAAPPVNRYAPAQLASSALGEPSTMGGSGSAPRQPPPGNPPYQNPYAPQQQQASPITGTTPHMPTAPSSVTPPAARPAPQAALSPAKYPSGDRTHIAASARPVYDILSQDMQRVKSRAPPSFKTHVMDTEKRLNILFDHLNNKDLLKDDTVESMKILAEAIQDKHFEQAHAIHIELMTNKTDECGNWMVSTVYKPDRKSLTSVIGWREEINCHEQSYPMSPFLTFHSVACQRCSSFACALQKKK